MVENEAQTDPINLNEEDDHIAYDKMLNTNTNFRSSFKIEEENFEINLKKIK